MESLIDHKNNNEIQFETVNMIYKLRIKIYKSIENQIKLPDHNLKSLTQET